MSSEAVYAYVMDSLLFLVSLNDTTSLYLERDTNVLLIVKNLPVQMAEIYQSLVGIDNAALAPIRHVFALSDKTVVIRDYIAGQTLADILEKGGCLLTEKALRYAAQIADGLIELHRIGLVHRDINPNNIIITADGNARIIDFGIMRSFAENKSKDTVILGTPGYAAPEQFGFTQSDAKTDMYSLGVLLNVMLTGKFPTEMKPDGKLLRIIEKSTQMDAKKRYHSVTEMRGELVSCYLHLHKATPTDRVAENTIGNADIWIKQIPGIRSSNPFVVMLSVIFYLTAAFFIFIFYAMSYDVLSFFMNAVTVLFLLIIPYVFITNLFHIWDKLPFTAGSSRSTQRKVYYILSVLSIIVGILWLAYSGNQK